MVTYSVFVVVAVFVGLAFASDYTEELVPLHYDYQSEYAPSYDNYKPRDYHFDYFVSDPHTGDHKSQWEVKEKGVVRGGYSLVEPDGTTRVVEYIADDHGFRAVVKKLGTPIHDQLHTKIEIPQIVAKAEEEPVFNEYNAYDGQADNYIKYEEPQEYAVPEIKQIVPELPIIKHPEVHETVEYHGFTGNDENDGRYTKFDDDDEERGKIVNYEHAETKPQIIQLPYKLIFPAEEKPWPYPYAIQQYAGY